MRFRLIIVDALVNLRHEVEVESSVSAEQGQKCRNLRWIKHKHTNYNNNLHSNYDYYYECYYYYIHLWLITSLIRDQ